MAGRKPSYEELEKKIRELEVSQEKLRIVTDNLPVLISHIDKNLNYIFANQYYYDKGLFKESIIGKKVIDIIGQDTFNKAYPYMKRALKGESVCFENSYKNKSGRIVYIETKYFPLVENGQAESFFVLAIDISDRKTLENQIHQHQKLEATGILAGGIAHDFNNILGVVEGNLSYATRNLDKNKNLKRVLFEAKEGIKQGRALTKQLITFSKGGTPLKKIINLKTIIKETTKFCLSGTCSTYEFDFINDACWINADKGQINQVFSNIIINANQAMPGGGVIKFEVKRVTINEKNSLSLEKGNYFCIKISDQGMGIPDKNLSKIFDPYFTSKEKGSGLGLSSSFSIVKQHGGFITVTSEVDKGSVFSIFLPESSKSNFQKKCKTELQHLGKGRVLLMDDHAGMLKMLSLLLKSMGYVVDCTSRGEEALELYEKAYNKGLPYSFTILDLTVPGAMGGGDLQMKLKEINPGVKSIASSGYSCNKIMSSYHSFGFVGVLPKPYDLDELVLLLNKIST